MLLSQKIAKNPNYLRFSNANMEATMKKVLGVKRSNLPEMRMALLHSAKFIVGYELLNMQDTDMKALTQRWFDADENGIFQFKPLVQKWLPYMRLPYPVIFIENDSGGLLVSKKVIFQGDDREHILFTSITSEGLISDSSTCVIVNEETGGLKLMCVPNMHNVHESPRLFDVVKQASANQEWRDITVIFYGIIMQTLMFLNTSNIVPTPYQPSKRENSMVPKPFLPFYEYKILDIFRERKQYVSLEDAVTSMHDFSTRRAHMVRGHFKRKNGKLFWWNPFMRNRKNLQTEGFVDKGYKLVDEEE